MTTRMNELWERLESSNTLDDVQSVVSHLRDLFELNHVVYHVVGGTGREYGAFTYDLDWVQYYKDENLYRIDPVVSEALRRFHPFDWKSLDWSARPAKQLYSDSVNNGNGSQGMTVPIRGVGGQFAVFSVTSELTDDEWAKFTGEAMNDLLLASSYVHQRVAEIMDAEKNEVNAALSPRERDALSLLASGSSRAEAADKLKISEHTFRVYVDAARHKLGALNTTHAVAKALSNGLILP